MITNTNSCLPISITPTLLALAGTPCNTPSKFMGGSGLAHPKANSSHASRPQTANSKNINIRTQRPYAQHTPSLSRKRIIQTLIYTAKKPKREKEGNALAELSQPGLQQTNLFTLPSPVPVSHVYETTPLSAYTRRPHRIPLTPQSVRLAIGVCTQKPALVVLQPEVAPCPPQPPPEPRSAPKGNAEDAAHAEIRVLGERDTDVKEYLLEARDGELGLDLGWRRRDFVDRLENRRPRRDDKVAGAGLVPVATILILMSVLMRPSHGCIRNLHPHR